MAGLHGKVAIVTGAARGTGSVVARRLVAEGARVLLGDVRPAEGEKVAAELGEGALFQPHDVTDELQWQAIVERALSLHGRVDVLVNNAAILHMGAVERTGAETLRRVLEVNTVAPYLGIRAVLPPMREQGGGSIVMLNSIDGLLGLNGVSAYAASKWGLRGLAKSVALELGRDGIRVNSVCPAGGNPEMFAPWVDQMASFAEQTQAYTSGRGIPGVVPIESIAEAVLFLASDASRHCTGVDLPVDGGAHAGHFIAGLNTL